MPHAITFADVREAAEIISGAVLQTPTMPAPRISELTGATVFVKHENMQATGSFKERGALVKLKSLGPEERARGIVAMSAGNHAQAVAYHSRRLGIPATIVMPVGTPLVKAENTRSHGAEVVLEGETLSDSAEHAARLVRERGLVLVHPYDDARVMAGQGTVAVEMLEAVPDIDDLVVPIGGGGLVSGVAVAARAIRPGIRIIGVRGGPVSVLLQRDPGRGAPDRRADTRGGHRREERRPIDVPDRA